jgi:hypothetical protein
MSLSVKCCVGVRGRKEQPLCSEKPCSPTTLPVDGRQAAEAWTWPLHPHPHRVQVKISKPSSSIPHTPSYYNKHHIVPTAWWAGIEHSVYSLVTGWKVSGSNPDGGEIFHTCPERPLRPRSLLYNGYQVSMPGVKRPGCGGNRPLPYSAEVKERVELYLYSPSGCSWPVLGRISIYRFLGF